MSNPPADDFTRSTSEPSDPRALGAGKLGMAIFLISLSVLFAGSLAGYLIIRFRAQSWRGADMPPLPTGLWLSTVMLIACSVAIHLALVKTRKDQPHAARRALVVGFALGLAFLINQALNWMSLAEAQLGPTARSLYAFTFYMLTGLHAAHVVGGLIQLSVVTTRAFRGRYSAAVHPGVTYAAMYWHFLDVVWLVMFFVMLMLS